MQPSKMKNSIGKQWNLRIASLTVFDEHASQAGGRIQMRTDGGFNMRRPDSFIMRFGGSVDANRQYRLVCVQMTKHLSHIRYSNNMFPISHGIGIESMAQDKS